MSNETQITELTENDFEAQVLNNDKPVLVDFWAPWCQPCLMLAPTIKQLGQDYGDTISIGKVNIDEQPQLGAKYEIRSIPSVMLFHKGKVAEQIIGLKDKSDYAAAIDKVLP
jgi:thioredoxin 1